MPAICREPAAKPTQAVCQMQPGATAQPIAAVVTYESSYASGRKRILANNQASKSWICDCSVSMVNGLARIGALAAIGLPESMISAG